MSVYNIITLPTTISPATMSWGLLRNDSQFTSPLTLVTQTVRRGALWVCSLTWPELMLEEYQPLSAFFALLADRTNAVMVTPWAYKLRGGINGTNRFYTPPAESRSTAYALGDWVVDTHGYVQECRQAGTSGAVEPDWNVVFGGYTNDATVKWVNIGGPVSSNVLPLLTDGTAQSPYLMQGDFLQLGGANQLLQVTDATLDLTAYNHVVARITPELRATPADASIAHYVAPSVRMQLKTGQTALSISAPRRGALSVDLIEVVG